MINLLEEVKKFEKRWIAKALAETQGNCAAAAKLLGMKRTHLIEKRRKYGFPMKPKPVKKEESHDRLEPRHHLRPSRTDYSGDVE